MFHSVLFVDLLARQVDKLGGKSQLITNINATVLLVFFERNHNTPLYKGDT